MHLSVREAAALLRLSDTSIYQLIRRKDIPHFCFNKTVFFNKAELLEWAIARSVNIAPDFFSSDETAENEFPFLSEALENGGIHLITGQQTKSDVLKRVVSLIKGIGNTERKNLLNALMARESLGSTAIGNGIAIPHARNPIVINTAGPAVILCFLETPIDFGALDGKPVSTLFTMLSTTARVHLHLLARLSYLLQNDDLRTLLSPSREHSSIISAIQIAEKALSIKP
jgi:PTS system nitrogen regulatory IIA component